MALARPVVLGNWKMHGRREDGLARALAVVAQARGFVGTIGLCPPATLLLAVAGVVGGSGVIVAGQDCHEREEGPFTGSIAAAMLKDAGASAVLVGHSERRHGLGESDSTIAAKLLAAQAAGMVAVLCIGETHAEYLAGERDARIAQQLADGLPEATSADRLVVAYEPVWAIGTGLTPTAAEVADAHARIRALLERRFPTVPGIPIIYGGSVKPDNAAQLLKLPNVDGALVGGASLDPQAFMAIARAAA